MPCCPFFGLLPVDLQVVLLHEWLSISEFDYTGLLKVLSALDVACSMSEQPSLRFLMAQLPPFHEYSSRFGSDTSSSHFATYLHWLASRKVPVKGLLLTGSKALGLEALEPNLILPLIETLLWRVQDSAAEFGSVMRCLPNLTVIDQAVANAVLVNASLTPHLRVLNISRCASATLLPPFTGSCPLLEELRIPHFQLTAELADELQAGCPNLRLLEVSMHNMDFSNLQKLSGLSEIKAYGLDLLQSSFKVLAFKAFPNLKRLSLNLFKFSYDYYGPLVDAFMRMLKCYPHLEFLCVNNFTLSREDGQRKLELSIRNGYTPNEKNEFSDDDLELSNILRTCSPIHGLSVSSVMDSYMAGVVAEALDDSLTSLCVDVEGLFALELLLNGCGATLTRFELTNVLEDCPLRLIAATCPQLTTLSLRFTPRTKEESVYALFAACGEIEDLTLAVHYGNPRTALQAIVHYKHRLKVLTLSGFNESDVAWFRQQIRDQQLLPAPRIIISY